MSSSLLCFLRPKDVWCLDSGCFFHLTSDKDVFLSFISVNSDEIEFGE